MYVTITCARTFGVVCRWPGPWGDLEHCQLTVSLYHNSRKHLAVVKAFCSLAFLCFFTAFLLRFLTLILKNQSIDIAISTCRARRAKVSLISGSVPMNFFRCCINEFYIIFHDFAYSIFSNVISVLLSGFTLVNIWYNKVNNASPPVKSLFFDFRSPHKTRTAGIHVKEFYSM